MRVRNHKGRSVRRYLICLFCVAVILVVAATPLYAASHLEDRARVEAAKLSKLIKQAQGQGINTLKESTALRTAEIFLGYAQWDERNVSINEQHFSKVARYKRESRKYAELLADFERREVIAMLESSCCELERVIKGEIMRRQSPNVDWSRVEIEGDQVLFEGCPIFLSDWTWKPSAPKYTEYHGAMDGFLISPTMIDEHGELNANVKRRLEEKPTGSAGMLFMAHAAMPKWAVRRDSTLAHGAGVKYVMYDIHNPLGRDILSRLIRQSVPYMAQKKYTKLGYMLCNEPHWNLTHGAFAHSELSQRAVEEFRVWLESRHGTIDTLNKIYGTSYVDFEGVVAPKCVEREQQGTPLYYDLLSFNMERVSEWFEFLIGEVKSVDPAAKTHIKIMPDMWSANPKCSGLDLEYLTRISDVIGNDASTEARVAWGKEPWWAQRYSFDWRELCMSYDFMKSLSPNKIVFNSEGHLLTTNRYRNLYETPEYVRMNYTLAHIHGLNIMRSWYWARREDGSSRESDSTAAYAGSANHQPRVVNEVHATTIDLNSVANEITAFQRQRKPIRIFYSMTSAINRADYMDNLFLQYEDLYFDGLPLGFVSEGIIRHNPHSEWDVVVAVSTPSVRKIEVEALQRYLDAGGTLIVDEQSLKMDEYGKPLGVELDASAGRLLRVNSQQEVKALVLCLLEERSQLPPLSVVERGGEGQRGVMWRVVDSPNKGAYIVLLINMGREATTVKVEGEHAESVCDYLTGERLSKEINLPLYATLLLEVR